MRTPLIAILVFALIGAFSTNVSAADEAAKGTKTATAKAATSKSKKEKNVTDLEIKDLKKGKGATAESGKKVTVHYTGWLTDGKKFDSSYDAKEPFSFQLGAGQVIQGWEKGVAGMKVGGKRKLLIPSSMGYGERGAGNIIPPNSTLVFEVELLNVENM